VLLPLRQREPQDVALFQLPPASKAIVKPLTNFSKVNDVDIALLLIAIKTISTSFALCAL
jgi:hypothetical protein